MQKLCVNFEHCYGIKSLTQEFDFSKKRVFAIYAQNGTMKTSFALTFKAISEGKEPEDRIFQNRKSSFSLTDENKMPISKEEIFVIDSYQEDFYSKNISNLLVNKSLKETYDKVIKDIDTCTDIIIKNLTNLSGEKKKSIQDTILKDFSYEDKKFIDLLVDLREKVQDESDNFSNIIGLTRNGGRGSEAVV